MAGRDIASGGEACTSPETGTVQLAAPSSVEARKEPLGFGMQWGIRVYGGGGLASVDLRVRV
jgi:hypothetical protein